MPKNILREYDNTKAGNSEYANFTVVVPGFVKDKDTFDKVADENGFYECGSIDDFKINIGIVKENLFNDGQNKSYGNQIAYELIKSGYKILYKAIEHNIDSAINIKETNWVALKDKSTYDLRCIILGYDVTRDQLVSLKDAYEDLIDIATAKNTEKLEDTEVNGRGDCIVLIDVPEIDIEKTIAIKGIKDAINSWNLNKYAAILVPKVIFNKNDLYAEYDNNVLPASFYYLDCAAHVRNDLKVNEWYAIAGYERGTCNKKVIGTTLNLGEIAVNALEPRKASTDLKYAVNVITKIRGNYYLWGNRTAHELETGEKGELKASHFLNIRQLCCTLKKDIWNACNRFKFDPNSDILWGTFCNAIRPTLEKMKADQGISDYKIIKVKSDIKALLTAKVRIVPIEAVEDFDISIYLEDSITGIVVNADEE